MLSRAGATLLHGPVRCGTMAQNLKCYETPFATGGALTHAPVSRSRRLTLSAAAPSSCGMGRTSVKMSTGRMQVAMPPLILQALLAPHDTPGDPCFIGRVSEALIRRACARSLRRVEGDLTDGLRPGSGLARAESVADGAFIEVPSLALAVPVVASPARLRGACCKLQSYIYYLSPIAGARDAHTRRPLHMRQ